MAKYKSRPIVIEAVQLLWSTWSEICDFANVGKLEDGKSQGCFVTIDGLGGREGHHDLWNSDDKLGLWIPTKEGVMLAAEGDYIVRGTHGELYPVRPDIFEFKYDEYIDPRESAYREIADQRPEWALEREANHVDGYNRDDLGESPDH